MRALITLLFLLVLLSVPLLGLGLYSALSDTPLVPDSLTLAHDDIARAKRILDHNDPRRLPAGTRRTIEIGPKDLNLATNYLLQNATGGKARLTLASGLMGIRASIPAPFLEHRNIVNIDAELTTEGGRPRVSRLIVGKLPVPDMIANRALRWLLSELAHGTDVTPGDNLIQDMRLHPDRLQLTYRWNPALIDQARDTLLSSGDRNALRYYHDELVRLQSRGIGRKGPLINLLGPLFAAAQARSQDSDPVMENTALLTVLGTWASRQDVTRLVPGRLPRPRSFHLKLHRRTDFAQHLLTSAALAARGDSALSDAVGLFKEISDTDHGSGFSFTDIAADRAGTRFGELASATPETAQQLQRRLAAGVSDDDIMPKVDDLPEHMGGAVFKQRFGHIGSPAYRAVMDEIERRINTCSLYHN